MLKIFLIALGGGIGSVLRYLVQGWTFKYFSTTFPLGVLVVNVSGCFAIGFFAGAWLTGPVMVREEYRAAILIGVLGGYTTFSTFSWETLRLADANQLLAAAANIILSVALGLVATWGGARMAQAIYG